MEQMVRKCGTWPVMSAVLAVFAGFFGYSIPAILIAISGLLFLPNLRDTLERYDLGLELRRKISAGCAAASFILLFVLSPSDQAQQKDARVSADEQPHRASAVVQSGDDNVPEPTETTYPTMGDVHDALQAAEHQGVPLHACRTLDGDTLECSGETIRLLGIDAPELPGHCRAGRICAPGDPYASQRSLQGLLQFGLTLQRVTTDRYGRTVGMVYANGRSLSCSQLLAGQAVYVSDWDDNGLLASECSFPAL